MSERRLPECTRIFQSHFEKANRWPTIQVKFAKPTLFHVSWFVRLHAPPWSVTNILFQFRNIEHAFVSYLKHLDCRTRTAISAMHLFRLFLTIPPVIRPSANKRRQSFSFFLTLQFLSVLTDFFDFFIVLFVFSFLTRRILVEIFLVVSRSLISPIDIEVSFWTFRHKHCVMNVNHVSTSFTESIWCEPERQIITKLNYIGRGHLSYSNINPWSPRTN